MKAWIKPLTAEYFHTHDSCTYSLEIATQVKPKPSTQADQEIKIQKEITRLLREQAIKNLGLTPDTIEPTPIQPTAIIKTPGG